MENKLKACLFDVDGVLIDSDDVNFVSLRDALKEVFSIDYTREEDKLFGTIPTLKKLETISKKHGLHLSPEDVNEFVGLKFNLLISQLDKVEVNRGANSFFKQLKDIGIKTALVSNARDDYLEIVIKRLGIDVDYFIGNQSKMYPKPYPAMYLRTMAELGVSPRETIIFEDSEVGLTAAKATCATVFKVENIQHLTTKTILDVCDLVNQLRE